jgi:hypothetical protein
MESHTQQHNSCIYPSGTLRHFKLETTKMIWEKQKGRVLVKSKGNNLVRYFDNNHALKADSTSPTGKYFNSHCLQEVPHWMLLLSDASQSVTIVLNMDTRNPNSDARPINIYFITCCKWFPLSFIHFLPCFVKLHSVHNMIWSTKFIHNSRLKIYSSTSSYNLSLMTKVH